MVKSSTPERENNKGANALVNRQTFREEIREYLVNAIETGALKPGERILETYWAKQFGVSQAPIREAIRDLEAIGLVETKPYCGSKVRQLTEKDIRNSFSVRSCLEEMALRSSLPKLTEQDKANFRQELEAMRAAAEAGNLIDFIKHDERFHELIVKQADNELLMKLWRQCNIRDWTNITALEVNLTLDTMAQMHEDVFDAILTGDPDRATESISGHLGTFANVLIDSRKRADETALGDDASK